jgi:micrococcal nuclease
MLLNGYAYCLYVFPNTRFHNVLLHAQRVAMTESRGIWTQEITRKNIYIGNTKSKRFHLPACPFGKRLKRRNRIEFNSKWDAFWEGYAPCKRCLPVGAASIE